MPLFCGNGEWVIPIYGARGEMTTKIYGITGGKICTRDTSRPGGTNKNGEGGSTGPQNVHQSLKLGIKI